ncbi:hypothetical protein AWN90_07840 [Nocardia terpenica]|uniref:Uncharacterized protein n=1 Tax=Nocardia terpenica TaxID=455432 RepID=A0A164IR26_9NOCA|nr:hypothetical protein AWN90_07840 [Nocardia terpenica]
MAAVEKLFEPGGSEVGDFGPRNIQWLKRFGCAVGGQDDPVNIGKGVALDNCVFGCRWISFRNPVPTWAISPLSLLSLE